MARQINDRINKFRRKKSPEYKLKQLWEKTRKSFSARKLILIARKIDYPKLQKATLEEFLTRKNLNFDDFYQALTLPSEILGLDPGIEDRLWTECFDLATPDNLVELISIGEKRAGEELFRRRKEKSISERKYKQILIWLFEITNDKKLGKKLWQEIKAVGPTEEELKHLLDVVDSKKEPPIPRLSNYIERLLAKRAQTKTQKTIIEFEQLVRQIKISQPIKQGQE